MADGTTRNPGGLRLSGVSASGDPRRRPSRVSAEEHGPARQGAGEKPDPQSLGLTVRVVSAGSPEEDTLRTIGGIVLAVLARLDSQPSN